MALARTIIYIQEVNTQSVILKAAFKLTLDPRLGNHGYITKEMLAYTFFLSKNWCEFNRV